MNLTCRILAKNRGAINEGLKLTYIVLTLIEK